MNDHVLALDQGTTSTRAIVFDAAGAAVGSAQREHRQVLPRPGWVEHDPLEIWANAEAVMAEALAAARLVRQDVAAVGITNQRETAVVWDGRTGRPVHNAIVWQDTRTQPLVDRLAREGGADRFRERTGLPLATYFAGTKLAWVLDHVPGARAAAERGDLLFGTVDSWLLWNLTGGPDGGVHLTDVTNASRTLFMDLRRLEWDDEVLDVLRVPERVLPAIRSSSEVYGTVRCGALAGVPLAGILGDQQAALFGQGALHAGEAKNTYGTGNFLLVNTGEEIASSRHGLLSTVAYRLGGQAPAYALEGSVAVTGSLVQWLRDNLQLFRETAEVERLAREVTDNGGAYFVPAFSGLLAPYWRPDARGALVGLTRYVNRGHVARAVLEATAYQTADVLDAVEADTGLGLRELRVDGGMTSNATLMQFQADVLGVPVVLPVVSETTAFGAAGAAGLAVGVWSSTDELRTTWREGRRWEPSMPVRERDRLRRGWSKAVSRTLDWVDADA